MSPLVPWILNTLLVGMAWTATMMFIESAIFHHPLKADWHEMGFFACLIVFGVVYLALDNPSEVIEYWWIVVGVVLGVFSAFKINSGGSPTEPPASE